MNTYIPADILLVEIDRQKIGYNTDGKHTAEYDTCRKIIDIITSLQHEQQVLPGYNKALLEVKSKIDELYEEASIGLSEYDSGLYNGIAETCMKLRGFIKARLGDKK